MTQATDGSIFVSGSSPRPWWLGEGLACGSSGLSIGGNINESNDMFGCDLPLPRVCEGDLLALLPAGAHGASMASDHCLRGWAAEVAV